MSLFRDPSRTPQSLLDICSLEELQEVQDRFALITGVSALIVDRNGKAITIGSNFSPLCTRLTEEPHSRKICTEIRKEFCQQQKGKKGIKHCTASGLEVALIPLIINGAHLGNCLIGQVQFSGHNGDRFIHKERFEQIMRNAYSLIHLLLSEQFTAQKKLQAVFSAISDLLILVRIDGTLTAVHEGEYTKAIDKPEEIIGKNIRDVLPPPLAEQIEQRLHMLFSPEAIPVQAFQYKLKQKNTEKRFECRLSVYDNEQAIAIIKDISDEEETREQLKRSLEEKNLLIKELYHRTKNNMQMIRSLLALQADNSKSQETQQALLTAEKRILSMSLVHQKLYEGKDLSKIDLGSYIEDLCGQISGGMKSGDNEIRLKLDIEAMEVLIETAIPIGLIVNELLVNSLLHAYKEKEKGEIRITIDKKNTDTIRLRFSDDGDGLSSDTDLMAQAHIGLQTVRIYVEQLGGSIQWEISGGLSYEILLHDSGYTKRLPGH